MKLPAHCPSLRWWERRATRKQYIVEQNGYCHHCGGKLDTPPPARISSMGIDWRKFPRGFLDHPVHLHHDHETGMTIGAVHAYCNAVLWQYHGE